ncbi:WXG100 family type VII secretion target [Streptomyces sp. NPDC059850]|uniref:WXG100 family type VII secretion target n=1 Tax=Streptomyces sp. NPDC059850 TaxID=3346970 RepID=UPI0036575AD4
MGESTKKTDEQCHVIDTFDDASCEEMLLMIANTDEQEIIRKGNALTGAKDELEAIGDELKRRVGRVTWDGEGGDAFREWGDDFAKQALKLAKYVGEVGSAMESSGQALSEVKKAVPKRPEGIDVCYADQDKEKERLEKVDALKEQQPAVLKQMLKLASYYQTSAGAMNTLRENDEPVFKPLPASVMPHSVGDWEQSYGSSGGSAGSAGTVSSAAGGAPSVQHAVQDSTFSPGHANAPGGGGHVTTPDATHTNIDGVKELPRTDPSPAPTVPSPTPTGQQGPGREITGLPITPPISPSPGTGRSGPPVSPVGRSGGPRLGGGKGLESINARPTDPARTGRDVVGGMPPRQTPATGDARTARGPVIGGEQARTTATGRTGMPTTTGQGVVGGRPVTGVPSRGSVSSPRPGRVARSASELRVNGEFTQGGSGLVRGSAGVSGVPSTNDPRRSKKRDGGETPDYLTEDEETWTGGERRNVPPVIE